MKSKDAEILGIASDARLEGRVTEAQKIARESIRIPADGQGCTVIASVSGGKDSTALILALREAEIPAHYVFADTGWEAKETYEYLEFLERRLSIHIDIVRAEIKSETVDIASTILLPNESGRSHATISAMVDRVRIRAGFPGRMQRFCTRELKLEPLRAYHDRVEAALGVETISAMGVRAQESARRAQMPEWEDEGPKFTRERWGGFVWRPLINWTVEDVLLIHRRHGVPVNPLYQRGHDRVGCYPCIFSSKEEIRLIAEHAPERIDLIERLEGEMLTLRQARNAERPGRYTHPEDATFFQTQRQGFSGIRKVIDWARTDYGGKQVPLFAPAPRGGCMRWGLCDLPAEEAKQIDAQLDERRYFKFEFDHIGFSIIARDKEHVIELLRQFYENMGETEMHFREALANWGAIDLVELSAEDASCKMVHDDGRATHDEPGPFPMTTFDLGAVFSTEY